jgi:hypothetical protein
VAFPHYIRLFRRVRKIAKRTIGFVMSIRPSRRTERCGLYWTDFHEIWYWVFCSKICGEIQVQLKCDKNSGYFIWRLLYVFVTISLNSSYNKKSLWEKSYWKIKINILCLKIYIPKIAPFILRGKLLYSQTGQRTHYKRGHAMYMLDNWGYRNTLRTCNTFCVCTTTVLTQTHLNVKFIHKCIAVLV